MDKVARPKPRKGEAKPKEPEAYTAQEVGEILASLENEPLKWQTFIRLLIDTGVRRGEACGLQWQDIDFKQSTATIRRNLCYTPKKGVYIDTPKSDKSRVVDLGPDTLVLLRQLRTDQASREMCIRDSPITTGGKQHEHYRTGNEDPGAAPAPAVD